jgi:DNA-binding MarR family transcriptional regulator
MATKPEPPEAEQDAGRFAFEGLDRVLHEKARLGILTCLLAHKEGLSFNDLRELCSLTDGNLSRHLSTLQEADLINIVKKKENRPLTIVRFTTAGKQRFLDYLAYLEEIVNSALAAAKIAAAPGLNPV